MTQHNHYNAIVAGIITVTTGVISEIDISGILDAGSYLTPISAFISGGQGINLQDISLYIEWIAKLSAAFAAIFTARKMMLTTKIEQSHFAVKLAEIAEREKALCDKEKCKDCPYKEG